MEIKNILEPWLDKNHPNYIRWKRSREISLQRGEFVKIIVETEIKTGGLTILDLGSGEGGTSASFANDNKVVSFDISRTRLQRQYSYKTNFDKVLGSACLLPFKETSFDLIIMQDVIEHFADVKRVVKEISKILKPEGTIFLSTPNKYSFFNIFADPHWGFPFVALMNRRQQKKYFLPFFRKNEISRTDTAELFSIKELSCLFKDTFNLKLKTVTAVNELFNGNKGIIWSNFHIRLLSVVKMLKIERFILPLIYNNDGILNRYFTPTFYFLLQNKRNKKN